jgi:xylulokinase
MGQAALVAGVDLGTGGVRAVACDAAGRIWAQAERPLATRRDGPLLEQDPAEWRQATAECLRAVSAQLHGRATIAAIGVTATSGTICLLDERGEALRPAIMYADMRAHAEAREIDLLAGDLRARLGYAFNSSWGLPKLVWLARNEPQLVARARHLAHAGDAVSGWLCGDYGVTDMTQALKTGYDLIELRWPDLIEAGLGLPIAKLPRVVPAGQVIGRVTGASATATGLPAGTLVVAGMTDGCASQLAAGAASPGQWLSVLGTTLVFKGVSTRLVRDPLGRIYCHLHPDGHWLPGAASNVGGAALAEWPSEALPALDQQAAALTPTGLVAYPLRQAGERFPFLHDQARAFLVGEPRTDAERYAATLEGVAYVERLGYDLLGELTGEPARQILTTGGGARSSAWLQIRADVLGKPIGVAAASGASFGAAVLAAGATLHPDLASATRALAHTRQVVEPRAERAAAYDDGYQRFLAACRARGYLDQL